MFHQVCGSNCPVRFNTKFEMKGTYSICFSGNDNGGIYDDRYATFQRSYQCVDDYNSWVPQPSYKSFSYASGKLTVQYTYTASVPNTDECKVAFCKLQVSPSSGASSVLEYNCGQTVALKATATLTTAISVAPNNKNARYYQLMYTLGANSLLWRATRSSNTFVFFHSQWAQSGATPSHHPKQQSVSKPILRK